MTTILVLGAGPAATATAIMLRQLGHDVSLVGKHKRDAFLEGASARVVEGFDRLGCHNAMRVLTDRRSRVSAWQASPVLANSEHVVDRKALDSALWLDAQCAGVTVLKARVRQVINTAQGWRVIATDAGGSNHSLTCQFLVEARGRSAPKQSADVMGMQRAVSLVQHFHCQARTPGFTYTEPFEEGWVWATCDPSGHCSVQIVIDPEHHKAQMHEPLEIMHQRLSLKLRYLPQRLGALEPVGPVLSRGIQPTLRGDIIGLTHLRVGDAAYSVDPLSGHGMYEALSGAFAAAPTINTILRRPQSAVAAMRFYEERATRLFTSRAQAAGHFYASTQQWGGAPFWASRSAATVHAGKPTGSTPRFDIRPVVEDGFIVERWVLITAGHPEGVRFIGGEEVSSLLREPDALSSFAEALSRAGVAEPHRRAIMIELSCALGQRIKQSGSLERAAE